MVVLLSDLEVGLYRISGASSRVQKLIARVDDYIATERQRKAALRPQTSEKTAGQQSAKLHEIALDGLTTSPLVLFPTEGLDDWSWALFNQSWE